MIAVVDDDVRFAEELGDFLVASGYQSVFVITQPHASSLLLLRKATILVLDLSLATTTALTVLETLREGGSNPSVIIVSGSGEQALHDVEAAATRRGFPVLGVLPKPVAPADLLRLLGSPDLLPDGAIEEATALFPGHRQNRIVHCASQSCHGIHLDVSHDDGAKDTLHRAAIAHGTMQSSSADSFVIVRLVRELLTHADIRTEICQGLVHSASVRARIVFDLGRELSADSAHLTAISELRRGGFGILGRADEGSFREPTLHIDLPITMLAVQAHFSAVRPEALDRSRKALDRFQQRAIPTVCTEVISREDFDVAKNLGFTYATGNYFKYTY